jgi:hypothetical protein
VHQDHIPRAKTIALILLAAIVCAVPAAAQPATSPAVDVTLMPATWQGPEINSPAANPLRVALQPTPPVPPQNFHVAPQGADATTQSATTTTTTDPTTQPLLDDNSSTETLMPGVETNVGGGMKAGVRPYGGGHPDDWSWGCNGSPYRTGPGLCDNYKVGPRWHFTADGLVMTREDADLTAIQNVMISAAPNNIYPVISNLGTVGTATLENFDHGPGGRFTFTSQIGRCRGWDMMGAYEGITEWEASIVYPIQHVSPSPNIISIPAPALPGPPIVPGGVPPVLPPGFPEQLQQRSLHYATQYHSGELNAIPYNDTEWRIYLGARFITFDDEIEDFFDQEVQPPLPFAGGSTTNGGFLATFETDRLNQFDVKNNLMGFQVGLLKDTLHVNQRFEIEGFVNAGVYYNKVKFSNTQGVFTTQTVADDTDTTAVDESRVDFSNALINDSRTYDEISCVAEASLTGVCRLNRCWSLRGGYQALFISNLHLAQTAFVGNDNVGEDLFFHGWHAGFECRR